MFKDIDMQIAELETKIFNKVNNINKTLDFNGNKKRVFVKIGTLTEECKVFIVTKTNTSLLYTSLSLVDVLTYLKGLNKGMNI